MILAISTSKPAGLPSRPLSPKPGWSNLVPMVSFPAFASFSIVVPAGNDAARLTDGDAPPALSPQAAMSRPRAVMTNADVNFLTDMSVLLVGSVQDLGK